MAAGGIAVCGATGEEYAEPFVNAIVCEHLRRPRTRNVSQSALSRTRRSAMKCAARAPKRWAATPGRMPLPRFERKIGYIERGDELTAREAGDWE